MRFRNRKFVVWSSVVALGIGAIVVAGVGQAIGDDETVAKLKAICTGRRTDAAKRTALEDLKALDTNASRAALDELAGSSNEQVAMLATLTIGRAGYQGADGKLKAIFEDAERPEAIRAAAVQAYARLARASGTSWQAIESYGKSKCAEKSRLEAALMAAKNVVADAE